MVRSSAAPQRATRALRICANASRRADPDDGRAVILDLTEAGRALHERLMPEFRAREAAMLAPLTPAERADLERLLGKLVFREDGCARVF